jgi:hypothetical protein
MKPPEKEPPLMPEGKEELVGLKLDVPEPDGNDELDGENEDALEKLDEDEDEDDDDEGTWQWSRSQYASL